MPQKQKPWVRSPRSILHDKALTTLERVVFLDLLLRSNPKREIINQAEVGERYRCWPTDETISEDLGKSARTVRRAIAALRDRGLLRCEYTTTRAGYRKRWVYLCEQIPELAAEIIEIQAKVDADAERLRNG